MTIIVNKDQIKDKGKEIIDYSDDFLKDINKFNGVIKDINRVWKGSDALKYIETMSDKYVPGLKDLENVIRDYGKYLKKIPGIYDLLDKEFCCKNIDV